MSKEKAIEYITKAKEQLSDDLLNTNYKISPEIW